MVVPSDLMSAFRPVSFGASSSAALRSPRPGSSFLSQARVSGSDAQRFRTAPLSLSPPAAELPAAPDSWAAGRIIERAGLLPKDSGFTGRLGICSLP